MAYHSWKPGNRKFYLMFHSLHIPPTRDLGPGVITMLMYLKSKEDSIFINWMTISYFKYNYVLCRNVNLSQDCLSQLAHLYPLIAPHACFSKQCTCIKNSYLFFIGMEEKCITWGESLKSSTFILRPPFPFHRVGVTSQNRTSTHLGKVPGQVPTITKGTLVRFGNVCLAQFM